MKLLFDQNISFRIIKLIEDKIPNAIHVKEVGMENSSDLNIWKFAKKNNYSIVTFDSDFVELANFKGIPPKIIWLKLPNTRTAVLATLLNNKFDQINEFLISEEMSMISILEIHSLRKI